MNTKIIISLGPSNRECNPLMSEKMGFLAPKKKPTSEAFTNSTKTDDFFSRLSDGAHVFAGLQAKVACDVSFTWQDNLNTSTDHRRTWQTLKLLMLDTDDSEFGKIIPEILLTPRPRSTAVFIGPGKRYFNPK